MMTASQNGRSSHLHWLPLLFLAASCGGGGGRAPTTATLSGQLLVPATAAARLDALVAEAARPMVAREVVVWLEPRQSPPDLTNEGLDLLRAPGGPIAVYQPRAAMTKFLVAEGAAIDDSAEMETCRAAEKAKNKPGIRCASPNWVLQSTFQPNDTHFDKQWHYPQINLPQAWDVTRGSTSVIVAVLDTGIVSAHPDFTNRFVPGFDMITNPATARDGNGRDSNPEDVGDLATPQGSSFHGTHVAGTIGANGNDGAGVAGVDHFCKLMNVRVLGQGGGSTSDIADGILFAARLTNGSGQLPAQRADIINMSLGGPGLNAVLQQACDAAAAAGCLLVAAAGNDNTANPGSPAAFDSVLSVGAVDLVRARAPYSNFSTTVDIWAPGGDMGADLNGDGFPDGVLSCGADDQGALFFKFENGTSMASPHVAGVAALVKAAALPTVLTAAQIRAILINPANTQAGSSLPNGGRVVDALKAVQAAGGAATGPLLVATPTTVDFGAAATQATITLQNLGTTSPGNLVFQAPIVESPNAPWLSFIESNTTAGDNIDIDTLVATVDRTGLANGVHQTTVTVTYLNGATPFTIDLSFRVQVGNAQALGETLFVLLIDPTTFDTAFQAETTALSGFAFTFAGVPPGEYLLVAGTDRNNDNDISDDAELFGAFPSLDLLLVLEVVAGEVVTDLDFAVQELATVTSLSSLSRSGGRAPIRRLR